MYCSKCGNMLNDGSSFCDKCGNKADGTIQPEPQRVVYVNEKSEGVAAVLSVVFAGLGQIYVGRVLRGLMIILLSSMVAILTVTAMVVLILSPFAFLMLAAASVVALVVWIWNIFDAYNLAKRYNESVRTSGKRPW